MLVGTTSLLNLDGSVLQQVEQRDSSQYEFEGVADLVGPESAKPTVGDGFFENKVAFAYRYVARDTGAVYFIQHGDDAWTWLPVSAPEATIGENTHIFESELGTTVVENTNDKAINIQLSPSGRAYIAGNSTETVIDTQDQWYKIDGPWNDAHLNYISHDGTGVLTYEGDVTTQIQYIIGGAYISPNNNAEYELAVFKDGTIKDRTTLPFSPPRQNETLALPTISGFTDTTTENMSHDVRVRCTSGTTNITFKSINFTMRG